MRALPPRNHPDFYRLGLPWLDLGLVALAGALWYNLPQLGAWPLLVALLPWVIRLLGGEFPFQRTPLDGVVLLLLLAALVGVWAAFDRDGAWAKFWLLSGGLLLYYALAGQPPRNLTALTLLLGLFSAGIAAYFLLTHDWRLQPADLRWLNRLGLGWMRLRITLTTHALHPNVASGLIAMTAPFLVACGLRSLHQRRWGALALLLIPAALIAAGLLLATSRGAIAALAIALAVWSWGAASEAISARLAARPVGVFLAGLALVALAAVAGIGLYAGGPLALADRLPGPAHAGSRLELVRASVDLISAVPFTGGGLDSFAGLYSQYILVVPSFVLDHGHNLFLDMALETGLLGALALAAMLLGSAVAVLAALFHTTTGPGDRILLWAALASLLVVLLHGLVDDILFGSRAPLLLFLPSGFAMALLRERKTGRLAPRPGLLAAAVLLAAALLYGLLFGRSVPARWSANLGSLSMARVELASWPTDQWADGSRLADLEASAAHFQRALQLDPADRTAHYGLGLRAMLARDYGAAIAHLEQAWQADRWHQGVRKSLGYSYLWAGEDQQAARILAQVPESVEELRVYTWWWRTMGRADFSAQAAEMLQILQEQ